MKVMVTGARGQLGHDVVSRLKLCNINYKGVDIDDFDIRHWDQTLMAVREYSPDVIIHCAAYTQVDNAEDNRGICYAINVIGTRNVVGACNAVGAKMIYISTDYVFNGKGEVPFEIDSIKDPVNYYGETKSLGEDIVIKSTEKYSIVRASWIFGMNGGNFVKAIVRLGGERKEITVVNDQIGSPTYTCDLAKLLVEMVETDRYGVYHATNEGYCTWYEFAREIIGSTKLDCVVKPILSEQYPAKAKRPYNSRLSKGSLDIAGYRRLPTWENALRRYINDKA